MQAFLILGLIPGTHYQINFYYWLIVFIAVVGVCLRAWISFRRSVRRLLSEITTRRPQPASFYHTRLQ